MLFMGVGMGLAGAPATESIMGALPRDRAGIGSAVNDTTRELGGALGVAIVGQHHVVAVRHATRPTRCPTDVPAPVAAAARESVGAAVQVGRRARHQSRRRRTRGVRARDVAGIDRRRVHRRGRRAHRVALPPRTVLRSTLAASARNLQIWLSSRTAIRCCPMTALLDDDAPDLPLLHELDYVVRAYTGCAGQEPIRGVVHDVKPPGLLVEGDTEPLTMHHMVVELHVHYPSLDITAVHVSSTRTRSRVPVDRHALRVARRPFDSRVSRTRCASCSAGLVAARTPRLSSRRWRQSRCSPGSGWRPRAADNLAEGQDGGEDPLSIVRSAHQERNLNTCHIWAEDSELTNMAQRGEAVPLPLPVLRRYAELGREG